MSKQGFTATFSTEDLEAVKEMVNAAQQRALSYVTESHDDLKRAQEMYEGAVLHCVELGCGPSAIGQAAGLSESTIRSFIRRRRKDAA